MTTAEVQTVKTSSLTFDETYQLRADLPSIDEYVEVLRGAKGKWPFPPLVVVKIGKKTKVVQGFTRGRAAKHLGLETVQVVYIEGGHDEALKAALLANTEHGYRRTINDKRKATLRAIGEFPDLTRPKIARLVGVSHTYVYSIVKELSGDQEKQATPENEPEVVKLDQCPVCKANDWTEKDSGYECGVCRHVYGESPGLSGDEGEVPPKLSKKKVKPGTSGAKTSKDEGPSDTTEEPAAKPAKATKQQMLDMRQELVAKTLQELGRVIRGLEQLSLLDTLGTHTEAINAALLKAKAK